LLGALFYDRDIGAYAYPMTNLKLGMLPIQEAGVGSQLYLQADTVKGLAPNMANRYFVDNISNSHQYDSWLFMLDVYNLFNAKTFRNYGSRGTLWYEISTLLTDFSSKAYVQTDQGFTMTGSAFSRFRGLFR